MEEFAINLQASAVADIEQARLSARDRVSAYVELTKPRITFLIVLNSRRTCPVVLRAPPGA